MLPEALVARMRSKLFWSDWFWITNAEEATYHALSGAIPLTAAPGSPTLSLDIGKDLSTFNLEICGDGASADVAIDDQAHWHPHALRWPELEVLARCIALRGDVPHPGPIVALLSRFAPICAGDNVDAIFPVLEASLSACGASLEVTEQIIQHIDRRAAGFHWKSDGHRWTIHQSENDCRRSGIGLYSLRVAENAEFPHDSVERFFGAAESACVEAVDVRWRTPRVVDLVARFAAGETDASPMLASALREAGCDQPFIIQALAAPVDRARAAWVAETVANSALGSVTSGHFGPTAQIASARHSVTVSVPYGKATDQVRRALKKAYGDTENGGTFDGDAKPIETHWILTVRGDLEPGLVAIEARLREAGAPKGTTLAWFGADWERRELR